MAALANAKPTCLAAHTNMILYFSESPRGVRVFPVPVGEIYRTNLGLCERTAL